MICKKCSTLYITNGKRHCMRCKEEIHKNICIICPKCSENQKICEICLKNTEIIEIKSDCGCSKK